MSYLGGIALLAKTDLKLALRDRSIILWLFIMPAVFFYFIGTVTQGGMSFNTNTVKLVVENRDGGFLSQHLESRLVENLFEIIRPEDIPAVKEGEKPPKYRWLMIPEDFTAQLQAENEVLVSFAGLRSGFSNQYDFFRIQKAAFAVLGDLVVVKSTGADISTASLALATAEPRAVQLEVTAAGRVMQIPSGFQQAIPGTLVMFMLLVLLTSGAASLVDDRDKQLLRRLASAPLTRAQVVLGKWAGRMALAVVQIAVAIAVSFTPLFDMDWGQALPMVVVILLAWGALCTSLSLLLGSLAETDQQAGNFGALVTMTLAALGGCWWPIEVAPAWMQQIQMFTPTGWTMDALHRLISFNMPWDDVLPHLAILITAAVFVGWYASKRFRFV